MPQTASLGYHWYETPNIHLCTIADFLALVSACSGTVEQAFALDSKGGTRRVRPDAWAPNFTAEGAIFMLAASDRPDFTTKATS